MGLREPVIGECCRCRVRLEYGYVWGLEDGLHEDDKQAPSRGSLKRNPRGGLHRPRYSLRSQRDLLHVCRRQNRMNRHNLVEEGEALGRGEWRCE